MIIQGDCLEKLVELPNQSVQCCVTSPPYYGLRDYGTEGQIGLEESPEEYVNKLVEVFREVRRVLKDDGTLWLNLGDSYAGGNTIGRNDADRNFTGGGGNKLGSGNPGIQGMHKKQTNLKPKDLIGIPWKVAFALQADGWYLRSDIIWHKPNAMPESVTDRPTKAHEYIFLLSKSANYYYDSDAIKETAVNGDARPPKGSKGVIGNLNNGIRKQDELNKRTYTGFNARYEPLEQRNKRTVWTVSTKPYAEAHFATYPPDLIEPCILAGCPVGGTVLDPFFGAGTTGLVATQNDRKFIGIELNPEYIEIAKRRLFAVQPVMNF